MTEEIVPTQESKTRRGSISSIKNVFKRNSKKGKKMDRKSNSDLDFSDLDLDKKLDTDMNITSSGEVNFQKIGSDAGPSAFSEPATSDRVLTVKIPSLDTSNLSSTQETLNKYLSNTLGISKNAYGLAHSAGDRAVAYEYFAKYMVHKGIAKTPEVFLRLCDVMREMYVGWSLRVNSLYLLVINLNGADATKEIMNIVNQSVYSVVKFVMGTVLNQPVPTHLSDLQFSLDDPVSEENERDWETWCEQIESEKIRINADFNAQITRLKSGYKYYEYNAVTPNKLYSRTKLVRAPDFHTIVKPFVLQK